MSKFYPHNIEQSRAIGDKRRKSISFKTYSNEYMAENQILHLQHIAENGLPDCYKDFTDFLWDFYPDFSWDDKQTTQIKIMLADSRLPDICTAIQNDWNFDMKAELTKALISE